MFRKIPPLDIVEQILRSLKLNGLHDKRWFSKDDLPIDNLVEWLPLLEPYYLPCKAERYLKGDITSSRIITVLRHILRANNIQLIVQERVINSKKITFYQIYNYEANTTVTFD
jgi:hypothetical protein